MTAITPGHRRRFELWAWIRITLLVFLPITAVVAGYVHRFTVVWLLSGYGMLAVARVVVQTVLAAAVRRRCPAVRGTPMVSIVLTVFNPESLDGFRQVVASLASQRWPYFEVVVVDDGSDDPVTHRRICEDYGFHYLYQTNAGKRRALYRAFAALDPRSRFVLTADDDTIWHPDATAHLVAALQADPRVGATTGHVGTLNPRDSWLTRLVAVRYWVAFEIERAAQAFRGAVTCVSGPLGGYRRDLIDRIADDFVSQRFLGRECTFGDDRHLTNLILGLGYRVTYSRAVAWTNAPTRFRQYRRQQTRWGKSHWREMLWTFRALPRQSLLLAYDWTLTLLLPFLLVASMGWYLFHAVTGSPMHLLLFVAVVVGMALVRAVPAVAATRDASFLWLMPVFGLFHLVVLLPLKFVSLVTVADGRWGTRESKTVGDQLVCDCLPPTGLAGDVAAEGDKQVGSANGQSRPAGTGRPVPAEQRAGEIDAAIGRRAEQMLRNPGTSCRVPGHPGWRARGLDGAPHKSAPYAVAQVVEGIQGLERE